ncbi:LacI family DNA-binding transcriptional regulator [Mycolicibacterium palauense]|uniref:LacI family DNA-binding transcriptional regulator n=1 Tax=Mycolicibacterium palauense TaxID=2034511 RepID=UPI001FEAD414|nr:substrate-binding domain-containing protein [Mycolicibacterium palauense]
MTDDSPITLRTIAEAAGVHVSTVSRALRRAATPGARISNADARIVALAKEFRYTPNPNAASLTTKKSTAFGVLVPHLTDIVLSSVYDAIEGEANGAGYETFVANTHDLPVEQHRRFELLLGRRIDGLILGDAHLDGSNLAEFERRRVPFVLVSRRSTGYLSVCGDDYRGGRQIGEHLAALGHTDVGIVAGPPWASTSVDRVAGCVAALESSGVTVPPANVVELGFDAEHGHRGAEMLLARPKPPTAIFAVNDYSAIGVMGALREHALVPGRDIAVAGYNDIPIAGELTIPLTTVRSPMGEMGKRAVQTLLAVLHGLPTSPTTLATELVVRESTRGH